MLLVNNISQLDHPNLLTEEQAHELQILIDGCQNNDRSAQEIFYKRYFGLVMGISQRYFINKDDALAQTNFSFLKIFQNLSKFHFKGSFEGWMERITVNTILDALRKRKWEVLSFDEIELATQDATLPQLYYADLLELLNQLPESTKLVFNLFAIEGFKHSEIAAQLKISEGTSKWHVSEAKKKLRLLIQQHYGQ